MGEGYRDDRLATDKRRFWGCFAAIVLTVFLSAYGMMRFWVWMVNN